MIEFLKKHFPTEVKIKQKENEDAAGWEQFGDLYHTSGSSPDKCVVM